MAPTGHREAEAPWLLRRTGEYSLLHCHLPESFMSKGGLWGRGEGEGGLEGREAEVCQMERERQF